MKLWLLERDRADWGYDEYGGFVIRAEDEASARRLAAERPGDEGEAVWLDSEHSTCEEITRDGEQDIILSSFNAG